MALKSPFYLTLRPPVALDFLLLHHFAVQRYRGRRPAHGLPDPQLGAAENFLLCLMIVSKDAMSSQGPTWSGDRPPHES